MTPDGCRTEVDGKPVADDQLRSDAAAWRGQAVTIETVDATPYKCIGGTFFSMQQARVKSIRIVALPRLPLVGAVRLATVRGQCRYRVGKSWLTAAELSAATTAWRGGGVRLDIGERTAGRCFAEVFKILTHAGVRRIGFISEPPPAPHE